MDLAYDDPPLVRGIHDSNRATSDWCRLMTDIILNDWPPRPTSHRTHDAELGLGVVGAPYYFYVMRTERVYGTAVFLFRDTEERDWPTDMKGATPFDSGDLWHGELLTESRTEADQRQDIFRRYEIPLTHWRAAFHRYLERNYRAVHEYIDGDPPQVGSPPIISSNPPNRAAAWTWEVRIQGDFVASNLQLLCGFLSEQDRIAYSTWLSYESDLDIGSLNLVLHRIKTYVRSVPPGVGASLAAERELLRSGIR